MADFASGPRAPRSALTVTAVIAVAAAVALLLALLPATLRLVILGVCILLPVVYRIALPIRQPLAPWRIFLPALILYNAIGLWLERPVTLTSQLLLLAGFSLAFLTGSAIASALWPIRGETQARTPLVASSRLLFYTEVAGFALIALVFALYGVPILSASPGATRVALAETATLTILAVSALQIVVIIDILRFVGKVTLSGPPRHRYLHLLVVTAVLLSTVGRSTLLTPLSIAVVALICLGWRRPSRLIAALAVGLLLFLTVGLFRGGEIGNEPLVAPAETYLGSTIRTTDRVILRFPTIEDHPHGAVMFWMPRRLMDATVQPPGIVLKDLYGATFEGFGLAPGAIASLYWDFGRFGVLLGGLVIGTVAQAVFLYWRRRAGWAVIAYAFAVTWLLLSVTQHPLANYWYVLFPVALWVWLALNRRWIRSLSEASVVGDGRRSDLASVDQRTDAKIYRVGSMQ